MAERDIEQKLQEMRERFGQGLAQRMADLDEAWSRACAGDGSAQHTLHRLAHSLAGSGATFGYHEISDAARGLERAVEAVEGVNNIAASGAITARMAEMRSVVSRIGERRPAEKSSPLPDDGQRRDDELRPVYISDDDEDLAKIMAAQIGHFGYDVRVFTDLGELAAAVQSERPTAILADVMFPEGKLAGIEAIAEIQARLDVPVPVYFFSARDDIEARLKSVRAGGLAYFTKPVDIATIIDRLDLLVTKEPPKPYRVLVVDDEREMTDYYRLVLESAGMKVNAINDPGKVLIEMVGFLPEVVLMDLYMPECSGFELAQMIRQQEAYINLPIIYISGEADKRRQIQAMSVGGDDFLTKPIEPEHLVGAVANRIERSRVLGSYMVRDSLTGLLNHTKTKEQLDVEIARAVRQKTGLVFGVIDIDLFKSVNDTYGHPTGDRVIKSLSRMLQQRLRKIDVVGRIGGEEFGVILLDTDLDNAMVVLDQLREHYANVVHQSGGIEFSSTFSCGIAQLSDFTDASALSEAADRALYQAKEGGRNQVAAALPEDV